MEADPNLKSLVVDPEGRRETQIQSAAILEESRNEIAQIDVDYFDSPNSSQNNESSKEESDILSFKL